MAVEVTLKPKDHVWRGRGRPRAEVPQEIKDLADKTYRTNDCGYVTVGPDEEDEARELVTLLSSYARSRELHMRHQREGNILRFEMVDRPLRK